MSLLHRKYRAAFPLSKKAVAIDVKQSKNFFLLWECNGRYQTSVDKHSVWNPTLKFIESQAAFNEPWKKLNPLLLSFIPMLLASAAVVLLLFYSTWNDTQYVLKFFEQFSSLEWHEYHKTWRVIKLEAIFNNTKSKIKSPSK